MMDEEGNDGDSSTLDDKKGRRMDSSGQETTDTDQNVPTHPAVLIVFRTDNILEEICSHLGFKDLKQFRLVSRTCNSEGRRELIKRDTHWAVVQSKNDDWKLEFGQVLTNLEETASAGGENSHRKLRGWVFKRLELKEWEYSFGNTYFLEQWGHYLRKIHLTAELDKKAPNFGIYDLINMIHHLLTVSCPNLDEMVVVAVNLQRREMASVMMEQMESLEFPSPLLKLKCLRIHSPWMEFVSAEECEVLERFLVKLVTAAGMALEILEIEYGSARREMEGRMLESLALNVGVSNFQSLKEISLESSGNVANLSHAVQKSFPKLIKLELRIFFFEPIVIVGMQPESFPALQSLKINYIQCASITTGRIFHFLQHFPNLEVLAIATIEGRPDGWPVISDPIVPPLKSLKSFTLKTHDYDLRLLRCAVNMFPNLTTLNLLEFGRGRSWSYEPEYSFDELMDIISPLSRLQHLYANHAFHTSPQLVDAIQLTSNFTALQTLILSQAAYNQIRHFNVSLYLSSSDPEFLYVLDCESVRRLKSVQLLDFRFGMTKEEVKKEASAKGGHVSFGTICPCYRLPWICGSHLLKPCHNFWQIPIHHE